MPFRKSYLKYGMENSNPHFTAEISGQRERAGAVFSTRQVMNVVGPDGAEHKGFYTSDSFITPKSIFGDQIANSRTNWDDFRPLIRLFKDKENSFETLQEEMKALLIGKENETDFNSFAGLGEIAVFGTERDIKDARRQLNNVFKYLNGMGLREDLQESYEKDTDFWKALDDISNSLQKANRLTKAHVDIQGQSEETNINLRNNAMSDYAGMLGMPNIVARSVPMTLIRDGVVSHGSFMDTAQGVSVHDLNKGNPKFRGRNLLITGEALRQISNLQVIDFLSGNIDRHSGNMFYRVDCSKPGEVRLVGVQGIDNDASFGEVEYKGGGLNGRMSNIDDIKLIDDETARRILATKPDDVENMIRLARLSNGELSQARERLEAMQERIRSGKIKRISTDREWEKYLNEKKYSSLCTSQEVISKGKLINHYNVFATVGNIMAGYKTVNKNAQFFDRNYPDAKLVTDTDKYDLLNQINTVSTLKREFEKGTGFLRLTSADDKKAEIKQRVSKLIGYPELDLQFDRVLNMMKVYYTEKTLSDDVRKDIIYEMNQLGSEAAKSIDKMEKFVSGLPVSKPKEIIFRRRIYRELIDKAKNISVFADDFQKKFAPKQKNILTEPLLTTKHTWQSLRARESEVTSIFRGSSQEFADMRKAFLQVQNLDGNATVSDERKRELYDNLADTAEKYLEYKAPNGVTDEMSDFAKNRVRFAEEVLEFAEAKLDPLVKAQALAALTPAPKRAEEKNKNPYTPEVSGKAGDTGIEYDAQNDKFMRFERAGIDPVTEYKSRLYFRNGIVVSEDDLEMIRRANPVKKLEDILAGYNDSMQEAVEDMLRSRKKKAAEYEENKKIKKIKKISLPEPKHLSKTLGVIEEVDENGDSIDEQYKKAYDTINTDSHTMNEYRDALMTVAAYHDLCRFERNDQILTENQQIQRKEKAKIRASIDEDPDLFDKYKTDLYNKTRLALGGKEKDYLAKTVKVLRKAGDDPDKRFECEEMLANVTDSAVRSRELHETDADFIKGMRFLNRQRKTAYDMLATPVEHIKDEARITIATAHSLSADSSAGKIVGDLMSGKTKPDQYSTTALKAVNRYIDTVKKIGKDPTVFQKNREKVRRTLAPYFCTPKNEGRNATFGIEQTCVKMQRSGFTPQEKFDYEEKYLSVMKAQAQTLEQDPKTVENYLASHSSAIEKSNDLNFPDVPKNEIKTSQTEKRPDKKTNAIKI